MKKIGILGGSFNPPHRAHLEMARAAKVQYKLDEIWFMPNHHPPHKSEKEFVSDEHRTRMAKLLLSHKDSSGFEFCDFELLREGPSYTFLTLKQFRKEYKDSEFYFIIGADSALDMNKWKNPEIICGIATILVVGRGDMSEKKLKKLLSNRQKMLGGKFLPVFIDKKYRDISSTEIRKKLPENKDEKYLKRSLPKQIYRYIKIHGVTPASFDINDKKYLKKIKKALKCTLDKKRYKHTLGVADTARKLGVIYGDVYEDPDLEKRAYLAGLLHDCAKYYTHDEQIFLSKKYDKVLSFLIYKLSPTLFFFLFANLICAISYLA